MVSAINPLLPEDGVPAIKADLRANLLAAKTDGSGTTIQQWLTGGSHDRGYASLAAIQADFPHAEALTDTIDWVALQKRCDLAAGTRSSARASTCRAATTSSTGPSRSRAATAPATSSL